MPEKEDGFVLAYCGLVCSDCGMYKKGKCQGCHSDRPMFKNCPVKKCAVEREYTTCADCEDFADLKACKKLHNWISRFFGLIFRTNRIGNLNEIREVGVDTFKAELYQE